jgi:hypothetical protein
MNMTCGLFLIGADELCEGCAKLTESAFRPGPTPQFAAAAESVGGALAAMLAVSEMPLMPSAKRAALLAVGLLTAAKSAVADAGRLATEHGLSRHMAEIASPRRKKSPLDAPEWAGSEDFGGSDF